MKGPGRAGSDIPALGFGNTGEIQAGRKGESRMGSGGSIRQLHTPFFRLSGILGSAGDLCAMWMEKKKINPKIKITPNREDSREFRSEGKALLPRGNKSKNLQKTLK